MKNVSEYISEKCAIGNYQNIVTVINNYYKAVVTHYKRIDRGGNSQVLLDLLYCIITLVFHIFAEFSCVQVVSVICL
jgi:hypothetical protein